MDGGKSHQNNSIFPLLQPARGVGVIIVNDNSADTSDNFPDGSELMMTYTQAQAAGLTKMPVIPANTVFLSNGLNRRPTFFGCNDTSTITIVYLPNVNYTFPSGESTAKLQYSPAETSGMIKNGGEVATQDGSSDFPSCLGCAITKKTGAMYFTGCLHSVLQHILLYLRSIGGYFAEPCHNQKARIVTYHMPSSPRKPEILSAWFDVHCIVL